MWGMLDSQWVQHKSREECWIPSESNIGHVRNVQQNRVQHWVCWDFFSQSAFVKHWRGIIILIIFILLPRFYQDELFDKARGEILDEVLSLSQITPQQWEEIIYKNLWTAISNHAIENIYLPSAQTNSPITFKTQIDISLKQWADRLLPDTGVKVSNFYQFQSLL